MEENRMPTNADLSIQISEIKKMMDEATLKLQQTLLELNQAKESRNGYRDEQFAEIRNMLLNPSQINPPPAFEPLSSLVNPESVETTEIKTNDVDTAVSTEEDVLEEKEELQTLGNVSYVQIKSTDSQFPQDEANVMGNQLNIPLLVIWSDDEYMDPYLHPSIDGLKILDIICTPTVCRNASMDLSLHYASLSLKCSQYNLIIFMPWRIMHIDLDRPPPLPPETMQDECYSSMQCIKSHGSRNGWKIDVKCELMRLEPTIRRMGCLKDMLMAEDMSHCRRFEWVSKVKDTFKMFQNVGFKARMVVGDNIKAAKAMEVKFGTLKSNEDTTERPAYHLLERPPVGHGESHFGALSIAAIIQNKGVLICAFWSKDAVCISEPKDKIIMSLLDSKMQKAGCMIFILTNAAEMTYQVDCKLNYNYASKVLTHGYVGNESIDAAVLEKDYMETDVGWSFIWIHRSKILDLEDKVIFEAARNVARGII